MQLKILSWNIWIEGYFEHIKSFLHDANADIIGLQEVKDDDPQHEVIGYLAELGYRYAFSPAEKTWGGKVYRDGCAVFSKHDIVSAKTHVLSTENSRIAQQADIQIGESILHVFSTHLVHTHQQPSNVQEQQVATLIKTVPPTHTVVMGDFNATPDSVAIQKMRAVLRDNNSETKPTWSMYPEGCNTCNPKSVSITLDYIFTTKDISTKFFVVGASKGSDHLPISVLIEV
jgi:endonuclease/exonuclease/phosphatase family metal-dependent hydrolase